MDRTLPHLTTFSQRLVRSFRPNAGAVEAESSRAFEPATVTQRIRPFIAVATLAALAAVAIPPISHPAFLIGGVGLTALAGVTGLLIAKRALSPAMDVLPPLLYVVAVGFLRHAGGGHESGFITMLALPLVWVALYGTRAQMLLVLGASTLVAVVPILLFGAPDYPTSEWRRTVVDTAVGALVIVTVSSLVTQVRMHGRREAVRASESVAKEAAVRAVLETAFDSVVSLEPSGRIIDVNPAALQMFHAERDDLIGRDLIETYAIDEEKEFLRDGMVRIAVEPDPTTSRTSRTFRTVLIRADGEQFPAQVSVGLTTVDGQLRINAFARDISEQALAEEARTQLVRDLQALLSVGRELSTPGRGPSLRSTVCETARTVAGASMTLLFEPDGDELMLTASAGRPWTLARIPRAPESSAAALVASTGEPMFSGRLAGDGRVSQPLASSTGMSAGYWQPIHGPAGVAGVLVVLWDNELEQFDERLETLLNILASQAEVALEMTKLVARLEGLAETDGLTGIANRRTFDATLHAEIARADRSGQPLSLIMLDLDHFKRFNDERGHQAGDQLLIDTSHAWQHGLRATDRLARYGGEEFAVILPDCSPQAALSVAARFLGDVPGGQTVSAGIATRLPGESDVDLLARADKALFRAKAAGRNRAVTA